MVETILSSYKVKRILTLSCIKNVEAMKQRDKYVDIAKGIAILLIVCIHTEVFWCVWLSFGFHSRSDVLFYEWFL